MELNPLQYPIGKFIAPEIISLEIRNSWIQVISDFPKALEREAEGMSAQALNTPYRPGSWTARQVIHHLFDSHMHCYIRFKMALTEDNPSIKPYSENDWAHLPDGDDAPIKWSIAGLSSVHARWVYLMNTLEEQDWKRTYYHPERQITYTLDRVLGIYAWHCLHHLKHVEQCN